MTIMKKDGDLLDIGVKKKKVQCAIPQNNSNKLRSVYKTAFQSD